MEADKCKDVEVNEARSTPQRLADDLEETVKLRDLLQTPS